MGNKGLIIRLIDVAMIILFGFIAISDIKVRAQIKLPTQDDEQQTPEPEPVLYFVKIGLGQEIVVERGDEEVLRTADLAELEERLAGASAEMIAAGTQLIVLIEPDEESPIQFTVDILDICERNNIPKNINYESLQF